MSTIKYRDADSLSRKYEEALKTVETGKNIKVGGALVTFPDKERNICELSATYMLKPGRFSKDQRVIVTLSFKRDNDGVYVANVEDSMFQLVQDEKGGLKEVWNGKLKEAMDKLGDIAKLHLNAVSKLSNNSS